MLSKINKLYLGAKQMATFILSEPTIFPDLNEKEQRDPGFARNEIERVTLKYKHFRAVLKYPEEEQMHQLMMSITGLSDNDLGELTPDDAATISHAVFNSMKKYMDLGKTILKGMKEE
jgi:hypothetical protein